MEKFKEFYLWEIDLTIFVGNFGTIKSFKGVVRKQTTKNNGYKIVTLGSRTCKKTFLVHRLVAECFKSEHKTIKCNCVNHIDGDKTNNHIDNLEWCSRTENNRHAHRTGLHKGPNVNGNINGEKNNSAKLTWLKVSEIREKYKTGDYTQRQLAKEYSVSQNTIRMILINKTWKQEECKTVLGVD